MEKTFALIKPDGVTQNLIGPIVNLARSSGLKVLYIEMTKFTDEEVEFLYGEHKDKPFYGAHAEFMMSGPLVMLVFEGHQAIERWRGLMGPTDPAVARMEAHASIRGRWGTELPRNVVHGSDSKEAYQREAAFFAPGFIEGAYQ